jgi:hypothetical protein
MPPEPTRTIKAACMAAAQSVKYPIFVATTEPERELVAARAVRAIATAVSTSPSYPVFIAAVTMAESAALIDSENPYRSRYYTETPPGIAARRRKNALNAAVAAGMAVYDGNKAWPGDDDINNSDSEDNFDSDSGPTPIPNHPYATQSSGSHSSSSLLRQMPI